MNFNEDDPSIEAGPDGLYAVMIFVRGQSESEIREDFSKFGEIIKFRLLDSGACFIRYSEKQELINCLREMQNNPKYNARIPNKGSRRDNKGEDLGRPVNNDQGRTKDRQKRFNPSQDKSVEPSFRQNFDQSYQSSQRSFGGHDEPPSLMSVSVTGIANSIPSAHLHVDGESSVPPPLKLHSNVSWEKELRSLHELNAIEVIVANLPSGIYQYELYELCSRAIPSNAVLHIEMDTTTDPYQINYATVYVKTYKHAQKVISELNGQFLEDNVLVVALADTILDDPKQKEKEKH